MMIVKEETCIGCKQCIHDCPTDDIILRDTKKAYIKNERCINCGHCIAICPTASVYSDTYDMDEVLPYDKEAFSIAPDTLLNFIKFRRSTRQFKDKPIEKEVLSQLIEAGRFTESATNSQDVSYIVLSNTLPQVRETIYDILKKKGEYIIANPTPETEHMMRYAHLFVQMYDAYHKDKAGNDRLFFHAPAVLLVTASNPQNGSLASSNIELMAHASGLGCCFCGFALVALNDQPELLASLGVEKGKSIISCLVLGYPSVSYKRTVPRKKPSIIWS